MMMQLSRRMDFLEIPVIDITLLSVGHLDSTVVQQIECACREVGFFYISGHGVAPSVVNALCKQSAQFFDLPVEEKLQVKLNPRMRGYLPLGYKSYQGESNAATNRQEGFWVGHDYPVDSNDNLAGPNQWPVRLPEFKTAMLAYFDEVEKVSELLMRAFALALNMPETFFVDRFSRSNTRLKLNHYPPQPNPQHQFDIGVLPHTDSGGFTILWQDELGGLEIQNKSGEWVGAPPIKNTFVINLGKTLQMWTSGQFSATPPSGGKS